MTLLRKECFKISKLVTIKGSSSFSITPTTVSFVHNNYVTLGITIEADGTITATRTSGSGTVSRPVITMYSTTYNANNVITKIPIPQSEGVHTDTLTVWWGQNTSWTTPSDNTNNSTNAPLTITYTVVATGGGSGGNKILMLNNKGVVATDGGSSSDGVFIITVTENSGRYTADKTYAEALAAFNAGKLLVLRYGVEEYSLYAFSTYAFAFANNSILYDYELDSLTIALRPNNTVEVHGEHLNPYVLPDDGIPEEHLSEEVQEKLNSGGGGVYEFTIETDSNNNVFLQNGVTVADLYNAWTARKQLRCKLGDTTFLVSWVVAASVSSCIFRFCGLYVSKSGHASASFIEISTDSFVGNGYFSFTYLVDYLQYNPISKTSAMTKEVGYDLNTGRLYTTP